MIEQIYSYIKPIALFIIFVLSALPLNRAVKIVKGHSTYPKTFFIMIISGLVLSVINFFLPNWGGLIGFIALIAIYKRYFDLKWHGALILWAVHLIITIISSLVLDFLISTFTLIT
ncbi:MAG: hypothetical protein KC506_00500 [Nanoarchaeota archaeon]|nr:hypothetical protein [Nanoarchaeota archaeon]